MEEAAGGDEGLEFKWGKQKGIGGKKKDVRFYESFTFDGDEYRLYDCVLVPDPNEPDSDELFVGKIIKIWEHTNKRAKHPRQVKLLWFFKPSEMPPGVVEGLPDLLANELFLASGEGPGLASVNPLVNWFVLTSSFSILSVDHDLAFILLNIVFFALDNWFYVLIVLIPGAMNYLVNYQSSRNR